MLIRWCYHAMVTEKTGSARTAMIVNKTKHIQHILSYYSVDCSLLTSIEASSTSFCALTTWLASVPWWQGKTMPKIPMRTAKNPTQRDRWFHSCCQYHWVCVTVIVVSSSIISVAFVLSSIVVSAASSSQGNLDVDGGGKTIRLHLWISSVTPGEYPAASDASHHYSYFFIIFFFSRAAYAALRKKEHVSIGIGNGDVMLCCYVASVLLVTMVTTYAVLVIVDD